VPSRRIALSASEAMAWDAVITRPQCGRDPRRFEGFSAPAREAWRSYRELLGRTGLTLHGAAVAGPRVQWAAMGAACGGGWGDGMRAFWFDPDPARFQCASQAGARASRLEVLENPAPAGIMLELRAAGLCAASGCSGQSRISLTFA